MKKVEWHENKYFLFINVNIFLRVDGSKFFFQESYYEKIFHGFFDFIFSFYRIILFIFIIFFLLLLFTKIYSNNISNLKSSI